MPFGLRPRNTLMQVRRCRPPVSSVNASVRFQPPTALRTLRFQSIGCRRDYYRRVGGRRRSAMAVPCSAEVCLPSLPAPVRVAGCILAPLQFFYQYSDFASRIPQAGVLSCKPLRVRLWGRLRGRQQMRRLVSLYATPYPDPPVRARPVRQEQTAEPAEPQRLAAFVSWR